MKAKQTVLREKASQDINQVIDYYLAEANGTVVIDFIDSLEKSLSHLSRHPKTGSSYYAYEINWPEFKKLAFEAISLFNLLYRKTRTH